MALAEVSPDQEDFWSVAPGLFELASAIGDELERSDVSESVLHRVRDLADSLPGTPDPLIDVDPYLSDALLTSVIRALRAAEERDRRELRLTVERIRQALRDLLDERPVWQGGPKRAAVWLRAQGLPVAELAALFAASETSVRRWSNEADDSEPKGEHADRVMAVAKIVSHLRHVTTVDGVVHWLRRPHPALEDRRPVDELKDIESYRRLIHLASGARSFVVS